MIIKQIHSQDAFYKSSPRKSGETSLNISNELSLLIAPSLTKGNNMPISFTLYREDYLRAIGVIFNSLPLYVSSSNSSSVVDENPNSFFKDFQSICSFFGEKTKKTYSVNIYYRDDGRIYLNALEDKTSHFNIRHFLVEEKSSLLFEKVGNEITIRLNTVLDKEQDIPLSQDQIISGNLPLQQIFYGAPGTGKSHTINEITEQQPKENVFRTTFHPDSDYSTFVGCYKPTMMSKEPLYKVGELINKLSEIKTSGATYPCHKFAAKYWESLKDLSADEVKKILTACGFTESMAVETGKGIAIGEDFAKKTDNKKIVYSFVPQSFTKAYLRAWQTTEPVYLVIEEINRGNCAQIFGDLFQLLDRKCDGFSEYPIKADNDLATYIAENLSASIRTDIPDSVRSGEELSLPSNLYIWATMNTSDQSLFPIDSAFKRRWDWKYVPIDTKKERWTINANGTNYDWSDFLEKINAKIESATSSEDKMLGFYFCKAENEVITAERFVNKVIFYLWNDVFKDYGFDDAVFNDKNNKKITFRMFYKADGKVDEAIVKEFLDNLGVNIKDNEEIIEIDDIDETNPAVANKNHLKNITFADGTVFSTNDMGPFDAYIEAIKKIGVDNVYSIADKLKYRRLNHPLISKEKYPEIENTTSYSYMQLGEYYFVKGSKTYTLVRMLEDIKNLLSIDMTINC